MDIVKLNAELKEIVEKENTLRAEIDQIIAGHTETISGLQDELEKAKADAEKYKAEASKVAGLQKDLETAQKEAETATELGAKYEQLKQDYDNYKAEQAKKETDAIKTEKFRELLKDIGLSDKGIQMALKWQGVDGVEIDEDGKITNSRELKKSAKEDWAEYITEVEEKGTEVSKPPAGAGTVTMTKEQIFAIKDRNERQKAIQENMNLFSQ